jgi:tetratricopeptide (TPR) repeat protein
MLSHLLSCPGQLVTKEQLLASVWPETFVTDAVLKVTIAQLREAFDDDSKSPRFIETSHRRGYRFVGQITEGGLLLAKDQPGGSDPASSPLPVRSDSPSIAVIGREHALSQMQGWRDKMLKGERQVAFISGEAGIGKTSLVEFFAGSLVPDSRVLIARGQCLEQYGTGEAYLPVLAAMGRLSREQPHVVDVLRAHAPMWLLQMPSLIASSDREWLRKQVLGATRERMLREMGNALEALTSDLSLVLILEDLHWSDFSTLDLISYLAKQRAPAHLMLIGTYRTTELIVSGHPLKAVKQELLSKRQCEELPLEFLSEDAVATYLTVRFPGSRFSTGLASLIHQRTEGNPLFMVNAVDYLVADGSIVKLEDDWELAVEIEELELGVPDSVKQMIEKQIDHLNAEEQGTLEAASVAGAEFSTLAVVAGLGDDRVTVEACCEELARRRQFIQDCGIQELPNGEAVTRYGFIHALYQNVLYERLSPARRLQLHRRVAERGEEIYGDRCREIAAELAMHFERGGNFKQAIKFLSQAADNAIRRFAYREAVGLSRQGLELLDRLPDSPERVEQELCLQLTLGVPLIATQGYAWPDVGKIYLRARELCQQLGATPDISEVLWGLWTFYTLRAEFGTAREIAEEFLLLADLHPYPGLELRGHWALEITFMHRGEFCLAMEHFEKALVLYDPERHRDDAFLYAQNPGVAMRCFAAWSLWVLGQPDRAVEQMNESLMLARELSEPHGLAHALFFAASLHQLRREEQIALGLAEEAIAVSVEHGLELYRAMATIIRAWALIEQARQVGAVEESARDELIDQISHGIADHRATGAEVLCPHFLALQVEALTGGAKTDEQLNLLEEALSTAHRTGEKFYQAELYRIKGEVLFTRATSTRDELMSLAATGGGAVQESSSGIASEAEECFHQAVKIAEQQNAKSWEVRATTSLARFYKERNRREEASKLTDALSRLSQIYDQFSDGLQTADLCEARDLLSRSGGSVSPDVNS